MANRRLNPNLKRYSNDHERVDSTIPKCDIEKGPHEGRHRDFVDNPLAGQRSNFGSDLKSRGVPQKCRPDRIDMVHMLPGHSGSQLDHSGNLVWQGHVTCVEHAVTAAARGFEDTTDSFYHLMAIGNLRHNPHLHVVDDESRSLGVTHFG